jgi:hypothetical protein
VFFIVILAGISEAIFNVARLSKIEEQRYTKELGIQLGGRQASLRNVGEGTNGHVNWENREDEGNILMNFRKTGFEAWA